MSSQFDASEFIDDDFESARKHPGGGPHNPFAGGSPEAPRAPSREEVDHEVAEKQQRIAELKQKQEELERERAALEELRRRQAEFSHGREEMVQNLTRGIALLEEAEIEARREAEQMAKTLAEFRQALEKIQTIREETWRKDELQVQLTKALTAIENARMEWNNARIKFPILSGQSPPGPGQPAPGTALDTVAQPRTYAEWCKLGLALTWPLALVALAIFIVLLVRFR